MKRIINLTLVCCLLVCIFNGCSKKTVSYNELEFYKVERKDIPKEVQDFFEKQYNKDGIYEYSNSNNGYNYLYLNYSNVQEGKKMPLFTSVEYEIKNNILKIRINEKYIDNDDAEKTLNNNVFYKINPSTEFDTIEIFKNGKKVPIDLCGA